MECLNENNYCIIKLGACLNIKSIRDQQEMLSNAFSLNKPIRICAREITQIDTASLQLLLIFTIFITQNNLSWKWQKPSTSLIKIADLLGMRELLKLPK
jgi:anti-anti-sigma regulatory factor